MTMTPDEWAAGAIGRATDPDGVAKYQCVDVPKDFFESVTGKSWRIGWPGAGNARDMLDTANTAWFEVIRNDPSRPDQLPRRFDIVAYAGTEPGGLNEYGHIGVVWAADQDGVTLIDQDGFQQRPMQFDRLGWINPGTGPVIGWLRLKGIPTLNPSGGKPRPIETEDWFDMATKDDLRAVLKEFVGPINTAQGPVSFAQFMANGTRAAEQAAANTGAVLRGGKRVPFNQELADIKTMALAEKADRAVLVEAVKQLGAAKGMDVTELGKLLDAKLGQIPALVQEGIADGTVTVDINVGGADAH